MPFRLKSHIILVLDMLQCVARVNCLVNIIILRLRVSVFQCTFESDSCGMTQDKMDSPDRNTNVMGDFDWARRNGATPTSGTGPDSGQETSGYYIYAETSDPQMATDEAR